MSGETESLECPERWCFGNWHWLPLSTSSEGWSLMANVSTTGWKGLEHLHFNVLRFSIFHLGGHRLRTNASLGREQRVISWAEVARDGARITIKLSSLFTPTPCSESLANLEAPKCQLLNNVQNMALRNALARVSFWISGLIHFVMETVGEWSSSLLLTDKAFLTLTLCLAWHFKECVSHWGFPGERQEQSNIKNQHLQGDTK